MKSIHGFLVPLFVPDTTAHIKLQAITEMGATMTKVEGAYEQCQLAAQSFAAHTGALSLSGFDDQEIMTGNASLFSEIETQHPQGFDVIFVPVGGGGLV